MRHATQHSSYIRVGVDVAVKLVALAVPDQDVVECGALELHVVLRHVSRGATGCFGWGESFWIRKIIK